jgi:threonine/homoserine/homoserine lactone efflux protein
MNFNSLSSNEKLAVYGAIAAIVGILIASFLAGIGWITLLAGIAMLVVVFLPQLSAGTALPGSKGSLMFLVGLIGGVAAVLSLLFMVTGGFGAYFSFYALQALFLLIGVAGGLVMAWAGWQEFQAEGGKFNVGTTGTSSAAARTTTPSSSAQAGGTSATTTPTATDTTGMGSTGSASTSAGSTSAGSTDMGSEGGAMRRDDEDTLRNP